MNKKELLDTIRAYQFYALELNLYLDNFPENIEAKADYKIISSKLCSLISEYEKKYGLLINFGMSIDNCNDFSSWTNDPWPWEKDKK